MLNRKWFAILDWISNCSLRVISIDRIGWNLPVPRDLLVDLVIFCLFILARFILTQQVRLLTCDIAKVVHGSGLTYHNWILWGLLVAKQWLLIVSRQHWAWVPICFIISHLSYDLDCLVHLLESLRTILNIGNFLHRKAPAMILLLQIYLVLRLHSRFE